LSKAVVEGFAAARGGILGVMDADLSHPPELIPAMLSLLRAGEADMVVASRLVHGGGTEDWPASRKITSRIGTLLARPFTHVRDPMSGYFLFKREAIEGVRLRPRGYKICSRSGQEKPGGGRLHLQGPHHRSIQAGDAAESRLSLPTAGFAHPGCASDRRHR
jgi:glycosyltransferase involved in cell wall biosynthesis